MGLSPAVHHYHLRQLRRSFRSASGVDGATSAAHRLPKEPRAPPLPAVAVASVDEKKANELAGRCEYLEGQVAGMRAAVGELQKQVSWLSAASVHAPPGHFGSLSAPASPCERASERKGRVSRRDRSVQREARRGPLLEDLGGVDL